MSAHRIGCRVITAVMSAGCTLAAAVEPAPTAEQFTVTPESISMRKIVGFPGGNVAKASFYAQASVRFQIRWPKTVICVNVGDVTWKSAQTTSGENLVPTEGTDFSRRFAHPNIPPSGKTEHYAEGSLVPPKKLASQFSLLSGTIPVTCEIKPGNNLDFSPVKEWVGKSQIIPGTDAVVTLLGYEGSRIRYQTPIVAESWIVEQTILLKSAENLVYCGLSSTTEMQTRLSTMEYTRAIPDDATMRFRIRGETVVVQVPFSFTDIPLEETPAPTANATETTPNF